MNYRLLNHKDGKLKSTKINQGYKTQCKVYLSSWHQKGGWKLFEHNEETESKVWVELKIIYKITSKQTEILTHGSIPPRLTSAGIGTGTRASTAPARADWIGTIGTLRGNEARQIERCLRFGWAFTCNATVTDKINKAATQITSAAREFWLKKRNRLYIVDV